MMQIINQYTKDRFNVGSRYVDEKVHINQAIKLDEFLEFKNKMSVSQWRRLPDEIETYNMVIGTPSNPAPAVIGMHSKPSIILPDVR